MIRKSHNTYSSTAQTSPSPVPLFILLPPLLILGRRRRLPTKTSPGPLNDKPSLSLVLATTWAPPLGIPPLTPLILVFSRPFDVIGICRRETSQQSLEMKSCLRDRLEQRNEHWSAGTNLRRQQSQHIHGRRMRKVGSMEYSPHS